MKAFEIRSQKTWDYSRMSYFTGGITISERNVLLLGTIARKHESAENPVGLLILGCWLNDKETILRTQRVPTVMSRSPLLYSPPNRLQMTNVLVYCPGGYTELMDFINVFYLFFFKITLKSRNMYIPPWGYIRNILFFYYWILLLFFFKITINSRNHSSETVLLV